jgi:RNA polymerase sigma factor (sigma-70 family)
LSVTLDDIESLATAAASGDRSAVDRLLRAIQPRVMAVCAKMLPCRQDAEEACQDALMQVVRRIGTFQGRAKFSTWLHVVASNSARATYRSLRHRFFERAGEPVVEPADPRTTSVIAGTRVDLLEALQRLETERADLVAPLMLRDICGLSYADIAVEQGLAEGTVKSRIHAARARMRDLMARGKSA